MILIFCGYCLIGWAWYALEYIAYGEMRPNGIDTVISLAFVALAVVSYLRGYAHGLREDRGWRG